MKFAFVFLASLFLSVVGAQTVEAQTRTIRHPETGSPALTVDVPDGWTSTVDDSNNLILASPTRTVAFSLSVIANEPTPRTLDEFAREVLATAKAYELQAPVEDMLPPYPGAIYVGKLDAGTSTVGLKMLIVKFDANSFASATMITGASATTEQTAVGGMVLKTVRVVR
jgi:hypothetical protein